MTLAQHADRKLRPDEWWRPIANDVPPLADHIIERLTAAGMTTVGDVVAAGPEKLREVEGIGHGAIDEIKAWLFALETMPPTPPADSTTTAGGGARGNRDGQGRFVSDATR